mgnify:CR=1 FL=1
MSSTLRIHRGHASHKRVVMLGTRELGRLDNEVNDFEIEPGKHLVELRMGMYHSLPTVFVVAEGQVLELKAVENPDAILPIFQGGAIKLERYEEGSKAGHP